MAQAAEPVHATTHAEHIEPATTPFLVRVLRRPCWNVFFRPARYEVWRILAATPQGAMKIARYHFYSSEKFDLLGPETPKESR